MNLKPITRTFKYGRHTITLETGAIGRQADSAVMASMDDTTVFATVVCNRREQVEGRDFFPLSTSRFSTASFTKYILPSPPRGERKRKVVSL